jgi:hypothetical protein
MPFLQMPSQVAQGIADNTDQEHAQAGGDQTHNPKVEQHTAPMTAGLAKPIGEILLQTGIARIRLILKRL